jgi:hypothetical protein
MASLFWEEEMSETWITSIVKIKYLNDIKIHRHSNSFYEYASLSLQHPSLHLVPSRFPDLSSLSISSVIRNSIYGWRLSLRNQGYSNQDYEINKATRTMLDQRLTKTFTHICHTKGKFRLCNTKNRSNLWCWKDDKQITGEMTQQWHDVPSWRPRLLADDKNGKKGRLCQLIDNR